MKRHKEAQNNYRKRQNDRLNDHRDADRQIDAI